MAADLSKPFEDLTFMSPLSEERAGRLVAFLAQGLDDGVVFDLGCGWAELLLRVVAVAPGSSGIGVDTSETSITHGRTLAHRHGLEGRVSLLHLDVKDHSAPPPQAVICIGASQIWGPPVEDRQPLDYAAALTAIRTTVLKGARVVYGECIWSSPPTPAAVSHLSGRTDEYLPLSELVELCVAHGFAPVAVHQASLDEWDVFESGYSACYARWLAEHDVHDPDAESVRTSAARQRTAYLSGYRGVFGMAYLELLAV